MWFLTLWDFWTLVTEYLPELKREIMARDGTLVIRPDSGDPVKILTGYLSSNVKDYADKFKRIEDASTEARDSGFEAFCWNGVHYAISDEDNEIAVLMDCEIKGLIECLWDTFGGTTTDKGFKLLDDHIGAIYGDAITLKRQREILQRLADKGLCL